MLITSFMKESSVGVFKANIFQTSKGYKIDCFGPNGSLMSSTEYDTGYTLKQIGSIAESWVNSAQVLNG